MPYFLSPFGNQQAFDANGNPLVGGSWRTFRAGTSTAETTYTSQAGTTQQGVIMTLDALGLPVNGPVWMLNGVALKFRLFNAAGVVLDEWDNITGIGDVNVAPDEWVLFAAAPTYVSATVFTVVGDQTNIFQVRRKLKSTNTGGTVYSTIVSSVFSAGATTVTVTNTLGVLDAGLSAVSYGLLAANNSSIPALFSRGWDFVSSATASASAQIDFTGLSGADDDYMVCVRNCVAAIDDSALFMRVSQAATFKTDATYNYAGWNVNSTTSVAIAGIGLAQAQISGSISNTAAEGGANGDVEIDSCSGTTANKSFRYDFGYFRTTTSTNHIRGAAAYRGSVAAVDGIRLFMSAGNIASGTFLLYRRRKS